MSTFAMRRRLAVAPDTAVLCALVIISPQLFGGAFPWSVVVIAGLSLIGITELLDDVTADVTGASRDQNARAHRSLPS